MIKVYDVRLSEHWEAGRMVTFCCPKCKREISVAEAGWWSTKCKCGYDWDVEVYAFTDDDEKEQSND